MERNEDSVAKRDGTVDLHRDTKTSERKGMQVVSHLSLTSREAKKEKRAETLRDLCAGEHGHVGQLLYGSAVR